MKNEAQKKQGLSATKNLLAVDYASPAVSPGAEEPIWLVLTTKKFVTDKHNLKPRKIQLPYPINISQNASICLITPEPQRQFKDAIAHLSFPSDLSKRITRVISLKKLEAKHKSFEQKRQLRDSYDLFLADDRIISYLAPILGKTFYKTTPKRPVPVTLTPPKPKEKKNSALPSTKKSKTPEDLTTLLPPTQIAKEINRTLSSSTVHLSSSTNTAIKVGLASFEAEQVAENIKAVMVGLTERKLVSWRNVRGVHVKGPNTMAVPVWLAEELWTDEGMVLENQEAMEVKEKAKQKGKRKRDLIEGPVGDTGKAVVKGEKKHEDPVRKDSSDSRRKKAKRAAEEDMSAEMRERRERLRQQKREAMEMIEGADKKVTEMNGEEPLKKKKKSKKAIEAV